MNKTTIRKALKVAGVKGHSRAVISLDTGWVTVGDYCGKIYENKIVLNPIDLSNEELGSIVIHLD